MLWSHVVEWAGVYHKLQEGAIGALPVVVKAARFEVLYPTSSFGGALLPRTGGEITRASSERGFAQQALIGTDLRSLLVSLTPKGRNFLNKVLPPHWAHLEKLMRGIAYDERDQLVALLQKLADSVRQSEAADGPAPVADVASRSKSSRGPR